MNKRNLVAAMVFIGLCTVVLGAPGDPNPALKTVAHDTTLTGDGTPKAPLSVVGGGAQAGIRVVDSLGQIVGPYAGPGGDGLQRVLKRIGPFTFILSVNSDGFPSNDRLIFYHASADCSDRRYVDATRDGLLTPHQLYGTEMFFSTEPPQDLTVLALEFIHSPSDPTLPGTCQLAGFQQEFVGPVVTQRFPATGLVPPFHLEF